MTTIAYSGAAIAIDSMITYDNEVLETNGVKYFNIFNKDRKIVLTLLFTGEMGSIISHCNKISKLEEAIAEVEDSEKEVLSCLVQSMLHSEVFDPGHLRKCIVVVFNHMNSEISEFYSKCGELSSCMKVTRPKAWGSGRKFATAAMKCGKHAYQAVAISSELDTLTGGTIHSFFGGKQDVFTYKH